MKKSAQMSLQDHRPRVAAERREKMRLRLLGTAMRIGAEKGPVAISIDDVILGAEVSRGSFYKYFPSADALIREVATQVANELIQMAEPVVLGMDDPAERLSCGIRLVSRIALTQPVVAAFLVQLGWPNVHKPDILLDFARRDLLVGIKLGRFTRMPMKLALNIISGAVLGAAHCLLDPSSERNFAELSAEAALRALGLPANEAREISMRPLLDLDLSTSALFQGDMLQIQSP